MEGLHVSYMKRVNRESHKKFTTPLQEMVINQYLDTLYPSLKERSKQTYRVNLRRFFLGDDDGSNLVSSFNKWLLKNKIAIVEQDYSITKEEREEVLGFLNKIYDISCHHNMVNEDGVSVTLSTGEGHADVNESIGAYDAFTFFVEESDYYTGDEFNIIVASDFIYNGSMKKITFQDIKQYVSGFSVVETKPISEYL